MLKQAGPSSSCSVQGLRVHSGQQCLSPGLDSCGFLSLSEQDALPAEAWGSRPDLDTGSPSLTRRSTRESTLRTADKARKARKSIHIPPCGLLPASTVPPPCLPFLSLLAIAESVSECRSGSEMLRSRAHSVVRARPGWPLTTSEAYLWVKTSPVNVLKAKAKIGRARHPSARSTVIKAGSRTRCAGQVKGSSVL